MSPMITGPGTITEPGVYILANDIVVNSVSQLTNGAAIYIPVAGVSIEMNSKTVRGVGLSPNAVSTGIKGESTNNLVVYNGAITGFRTGFQSLTPWTRIQGVNLSGNYAIGADMQAHTARVYYCTINAIGGATNDPYAVGVNLCAGSYEVLCSTFLEIYRQAGSDPLAVGEGCAILVNSSSSGGWAERNWVENSQLAPHTFGYFAGSGGAHRFTRNVVRGHQIAVAGGGQATCPLTAQNNVLSQAGYAADTTGFSCDHGLVESNVILNYALPINGAVAVGAGNTILGDA